MAVRGLFLPSAPICEEEEDRNNAPGKVDLP